jgi:dipeptidyl aminopeptidase/acylaminoacyl peptidase
MNGTGDSTDRDPINRESAKLQCAVARAAPIDLLRIDTSVGATALALLLGARADESTPKGSIEYKTAWVASPINYVSRDAAPMLLIHGDADRTVPFRQSEMMEAALKNVNVPVKLIRVEGGDHGPDFPGATNPPNYKEEIVKWFDMYLRNRSSSQ